MGFLTSYIESTIELSFSTVFFVVFVLITCLVVRRRKGASKVWLLVASLVSASMYTSCLFTLHAQMGFPKPKPSKY
ncbi:hypothetical protein ASPSYDRAFT_383091 [Aspergillus sydowii CBS 593.65]|uniref:Uncharacterized protein n=1 Tax=Aspergillus sydowii CBS 593.65 TaxID=1036612 RepID=A0A1L9T8T6_9EURO|nr:uncharacterized protein ASPSYDRAFT_383091 [Aspergillus sydowii CBS 593.65]OJJ55801.1 hypothetical protein ASPSYDRAFT_383091 [Aspergillus sydowii CBS 593.65]